MTKQYLSFSLVCLLWAAIASCSATPTRLALPWQPDHLTDLAYRVNAVVGPDGRKALMVDVAVSQEHGPLPNPLFLRINSNWAGQTDLGADLDDLMAWSPDGTPLEAHLEDGVARVEHSGISSASLRYRVAPQTERLTAESRFRPISNRRTLVADGRHLFLWPESEAFEEADWSVLLASGDWFSTHSASPHQTEFEGHARTDLWDSSWLEGRHLDVGGVIAGRSIRLAVDPDSRLDTATLLTQISRVVAAAERDFGPTPEPHTSVIVLRRADQPDEFTGSGRRGGFVLELGDHAPIGSPDLAVLVAHEHLHRYIGLSMRFDDWDAMWTMWFREGVVSYLAAGLAYRASSTDAEQVLRTLSEAASGYLANPNNNRPLSEWSVSEYWSNLEMRRLAYEKGTLLAAWLDVALREHGPTLAQFVAEFYASHQGETIDSTVINEALQEALGRD
ncbi:MAG: hypothetical protein KC561_16435, partial [Myxococcales bacterium]|nr:hypothetical protein [Myxococcales bacterium]